MKATKIELYTETKIGIEYYPEDFEDSDTWEEFVDKLIRDKDYMKTLFAREILSDAKGLMKDLGDQVIENKTVVLINIETEGIKKSRMALRP